MDRLEIFLFTTSAAMLTIIFILLRHRRLSEYYALFWIAFGILLVCLTVFRHQIDSLAAALGIQYGPVFVLTMGLLFSLLLNLHLGLRLNDADDKIRAIAEALAIVEANRDQNDEWGPDTSTGTDHNNDD